MAAEKVHAEKMYTDAKKAIGRERGKIKTKRHPKGTENILRKVAHLQDGVRFSSTSSREIVDFLNGTVKATKLPTGVHQTASSVDVKKMQASLVRKLYDKDRNNPIYFNKNSNIRALVPQTQSVFVQASTAKKALTSPSSLLWPSPYDLPWLPTPEILRQSAWLASEDASCGVVSSSESLSSGESFLRFTSQR